MIRRTNDVCHVSLVSAASGPWGVTVTLPSANVRLSYDHEHDVVLDLAPVPEEWRSTVEEAVALLAGEVANDLVSKRNKKSGECTKSGQ